MMIQNIFYLKIYQNKIILFFKTIFDFCTLKQFKNKKIT